MTHAESEPQAGPVVKVARDLTEIERLSAELEAQAVDSSTDRLMPGGKATVALASVANLEAWENRFETAERLGLDTSYVQDEDDTWEPPLQTLCFWSEEWRREHDAEYDQRPTIASEANFIRWCLEWAWDNEAKWDDFARDIRQARVRLEDLVHAGRRVERTRVVCANADCERKPRLIKLYGPTEDEDAYKCPACKRRYDPDEYRKAYAKQLRSEGAERFVPSTEAVATLKSQGRSLATVRRWLAPPVDHVKDECPDCDKRWRKGTKPRCPKCGGRLKPVYRIRGEDVPHGYCDLPTRRTFLWWPDLWHKHLTTPQRKRKDAA